MTLPVRRPHELPSTPEENRWLVQTLWGDEAVGIVGGEPKCYKSFLALDLAIAVASGAPCLRLFEPRQRGPVLVLSAEDSLPEVRRRIERIATAASVPFASLDIYVITRPQVRLDVLDDRSDIKETVKKIGPKMIVLDPFVRLHRQDENAASDVAPLLGFLREIQQKHHTAVVLVHHARKGGGSTRAGQALRGSSELHAWGDSNLYLRKVGENDFRMTVEHRAASSPGEFVVQLREDGPALALHATPIEQDELEEASARPSPSQRIERVLQEASGPLSIRQLRDACRIRTTTLCETLDALAADGRVRKSTRGYLIAAP